jgi:Holliday junction resolvase-like predicted endonuclease
VELAHHSKKDIGALGEKVAAEYLKRQGMTIVAKNVARKTGEIDVIAREGNTLHFVEVKTLVCENFPLPGGTRDEYDPSLNLHEMKIRRVARTSEWYVANIDWEGEWQVDGVLVWLRRRDGMAKVRYLPQIL